MENLSNLPDDCLKTIFYCLPLGDRINKCERVCRRWKCITPYSDFTTFTTKCMVDIDCNHPVYCDQLFPCGCYRQHQIPIKKCVPNELLNSNQRQISCYFLDACAAVIKRVGKYVHIFNFTFCCQISNHNQPINFVSNLLQNWQILLPQLKYFHLMSSSKYDAVCCKDLSIPLEVPISAIDLCCADQDYAEISNFINIDYQSIIQQIQIIEFDHYHFGPQFPNCIWMQKANNSLLLSFLCIDIDWLIKSNCSKSLQQLIDFFPNISKLCLQPNQSCNPISIEWKSISQLEMLIIEKGNLTNFDLFLICTNMTQLTYLGLYYQELISDYRPIGKLKHLEKLILACCLHLDSSSFQSICFELQSSALLSLTLGFCHKNMSNIKILDISALKYLNNLTEFFFAFDSTCEQQLLFSPLNLYWSIKWPISLCQVNIEYLPLTHCIELLNCCRYLLEICLVITDHCCCNCCHRDDVIDNDNTAANAIIKIDGCGDVSFNNSNIDQMIQCFAAKLLDLKYLQSIRLWANFRMSFEQWKHLLSCFARHSALQSLHLELDDANCLKYLLVERSRLIAISQLNLHVLKFANHSKITFSDDEIDDLEQLYQLAAIEKV